MDLEVPVDQAVVEDLAAAGWAPPPDGGAPGSRAEGFGPRRPEVTTDLLSFSHCRHRLPAA